MKNSLFKRAVAAVAAVPLALTQSLTCSFAATDVSVPVNVAATETADKSFTLNTLLHIAPDDEDQFSDWNFNASTALDVLYKDGKASGPIDAAKMFDRVSSYAGQYEDIAKAVVAKVTDGNYEITKTGDIILTAKVGDIAEALSENVDNSLGKLAQDLADKYNQPSLAKIDFKSVKISGSIKVTIGSSALAAKTEVPVSFEFTPDDTNKPLGPEATVQYAKDKLAELKQKAYDGIDEVKEYIDTTAAKKDVDDNVKRYENALNKASNAFDRFLNANKEGKFDSVAKLIERVNKWNQLTKRNKQIPANGAAIAANDKVQKAFTRAKNFFNNHAAPYTLDVEAKDLGEFADKLYSLDAGIAGGKGTFTANFPEDEFEALDAYYADSDKEVDHENTYKQIIVKVDGNAIKETGFTVDVKVKRILVLKDKETTTSTTETTTSTETTSTDVTEESSTTTSTDVTEESSTTTSTDVTEESSTTTSTDVTEESSTTTSTDVTEESSTTTSTDVTEESSTTTSTDVTEESSTTTSTDVTEESSTTTSTDVTEESSTTTSTDVTEESSTTTSTDVTDVSSTTTSTDVTEESSTTSTTGTEPEVLKVSLIKGFKPYVDDSNLDPEKRGLSAKYGFYTQVDEAFSKDQVDKFELTLAYTQDVLDNGKVKGVTVKKKLSVIDKFDFGTATPQNTFDRSVKNFKYSGSNGVKLYATQDIKFSDFFADDENVKKLFADGTVEDEVLIKKGDVYGNDSDADFSEPMTIEVYIGIKGDADLDGRMSADDASLALAYFAKLSDPTLTAEQRDAIQLSSNKELAKKKNAEGEYEDNPTGIYDNFAAFLIDTYAGNPQPVATKDNWRVGKHDMFTGTKSRMYSADDASYILRYFSWAAGEATKYPEETGIPIAEQVKGWNLALGKTAE
ncbi:hypothetical protein [uncultured Ruminococcus sp.]|uniref:hypothetical protein n=1 Tax=uncultured Ruminococcus sp. TaxID=165186 RepID=UPI0026208AFE|nr:hypothetical protein [uncultured Ruminococcus sp.]